jgi:hypothetical protein
MIFLALILSLTSFAVETITTDIKALESLEKRPYFKPEADWVGIPMPFGPVEKIREELENRIGKKLQHRGEAHIAVITPPEFRILAQTLKMNTIDKIVAKEGSMKAPIKVLCLKKVTAVLGNKTEESWFISVDSPELREFRNQVWRRFVANGGLPGDFVWKRWAPHITVGFTSRDLHDEDRISKEKADCAYELKAL